MTMRQGRPTSAAPNVLRDQTVPNTLRGMGPAPARTVRPVGRQLSGLPLPILLAIAIAAALILLGRAP